MFIKILTFFLLYICVRRIQIILWSKKIQKKIKNKKKMKYFIETMS